MRELPVERFIDANEHYFELSLARQRSKRGPNNFHVMSIERSADPTNSYERRWRRFDGCVIIGVYHSWNNPDSSAMRAIEVCQEVVPTDYDRVTACHPAKLAMVA